MSPPEMRRPRHGSGADADTKLHQPRRSITEGPDSVDQALAEIRRWQRDARIVADDPALSIRQKCKALLEMSFRARRSDLAAFLEVALWKGAKHLFEDDTGVPTNTIDAIRRLRH